MYLKKRHDVVIYLNEDFDHIKESFYLAAKAWNEFKTQSNDVVNYIVDDSDNIKGSLFLAA